MSTIKTATVTATVKPSQRFHDKFLVLFEKEIMYMAEPTFKFQIIGNPKEVMDFVAKNLNPYQIESLTINF